MNITDLLSKSQWTQDEIYAYIRAMDDVSSVTALLVGETAREPLLGKLAVACVARNRVHDKRRWPNTYTDVLCKYRHFSCFNSALFRREIIRVNKTALWWRECKFAAWGVVNDYVGDVSRGATHYWNPDLVTPKWAPKMIMLDKIGLHQFAREPS